MNNHDIILNAQTGSGKTMAFLLPYIDKLMQNEFTRTKNPTSLILAPTRELAGQINNEMVKLSFDSGIRGVAV